MQSQKLLFYEKQVKRILLYQFEVHEKNLVYIAFGIALGAAAVKYVEPPFIAYCKK